MHRTLTDAMSCVHVCFCILTVASILVPILLVYTSSTIVTLLDIPPTSVTHLPVVVGLGGVGEHGIRLIALDSWCGDVPMVTCCCWGWNIGGRYSIAVVTSVTVSSSSSPVRAVTGPI